MKGLGRLFNLATSATTAAVRVSMRDCASLTIVAIGATSGNVTIQECNAASGGTAQNLACISTYWTQNNGVWTKNTQVAAATFTLATGGLAVAEINEASLSDGFAYITASHASASFVMIPCDLEVQRSPAALRAIGA